MPTTRHAVHRTILVFDIEGFGDKRRTNADQVTVRAGMYRTLENAFQAIGVAWSECDHEDRGDGLFVLVPPEIPKELFVDVFPLTLADAIEAHNATHAEPEHMRMRMSLHAGEVTYDVHGVSSAAVNLAFRLIDAQAAKKALADSSAMLVLVASDWFYNEVIAHCEAADPGRYREVTVTVKETTVPAWLFLPVLPESTALPAADDVPRQLPASPRFFTGRTRELAELSNAVRSETSRQALVIMSICGLGGMGKTWLVLHWANRNKHRFPDGQLYVNLRGFEPSGAPLTPEVVMRGFLDALHVPPGSIPVSADAQTALYRSLVADKRMLIVLDNARDSAQVAPLLPGGSTCTVLVTSRHQLTNLVTAHAAQPLVLHELDRDDARDILIRRLGRARVAANTEATEELLDHCDGHPLALSIFAANAAIHPGFELVDLVAELSRAPDPLSAFDGVEYGTSLRAVLSWSYRTLDHEQATAFRLLGLAPGPDIGSAAAASLLDVPSPVSILRGLENANLLHQHAPGRYRMHDLVRLYAVRSAGDIGEPETAALRRLIDHYVHASHTAERRLYPHRKAIDVGVPPTGSRRCRSTATPPSSSGSGPSTCACSRPSRPPCG